jgi:hypothetical protein
MKSKHTICACKFTIACVLRVAYVIIIIFNVVVSDLDCLRSPPPATAEYLLRI